MKIGEPALGAVLLAVATMILSLSSGCTSMASGGYQLKQTRNDMDAAMVRYQNRAAFGFLTVSEQERVTAAYKAFQTAFNDAAQQAHANYTAPTPNNVKALADQLLSILDAIP